MVLIYETMIRSILFLIIVAVASQVSVVGDAFAQIPHKATSDTTSVNADSTTIAVLRESSAGHIMWHDIKEGAYDGLQYVERPLHWDLREWAIVATGIGFSAMLELVDDPLVRDFFQHNQGKVGNTIETFGNNFYGNGYATGLTALTLYTVGISTDNNKLRVMGRHVIQSFAYAGLTTTALKILLGRNRPILNQGALVYHGFSLSNAWNSMPSGHVTVALPSAKRCRRYQSDLGILCILCFRWRDSLQPTLFRSTLVQRYVSRGCHRNGRGYWVSQEQDHYDMKTNDPKPTSFLIVPTLNGISFAYQF